MLPDVFRLDGKLAMVTGAGNPLAHAVGVAFAEAGADIVAVSHRPEAAQALAAAAGALGRKATAVTADMTRAAEVRRATDEALTQHGAIDVLLLGDEAVVAAPLADLEEDAWDTVMAVNAKSVYLGAKTVGAHMVARGRGRIIVLAHGLAVAGVPNTAVYAASKGAAVQFARGLGLEWATTGVTVNAIAPGWFAGAWETDLVDPLARFVPMRRRGRPEELGPLAVYLASDVAAYVTASLTIIDGGQICHA
ncbi:MAG: SDR family oxidoreductase [Dehalococcoidia bacterium]